jgi:peptidoglycan hydrolase CwlO-like protein
VKLVTLFLVLTLGLAVQAHASQTPGDSGKPPATKGECLKRLKGFQHEYAGERASFPARKRAAQKLIDARRARVTALQTQYDGIQTQIDTVQNTPVTTQEAADAANKQIDALIAKQRALKTKVDTAEGKVDEAVEALKALVAKYRDDMKNWPIYIKQIKAYCAKM